MQWLRTLGVSSLISVWLIGGCSDQKTSISRVLQGVVTDSKGAPIAGVVVRLGDDSATSNEDGEFKLAPSESSGTVRFEKSGYLTGLEHVELLDYPVALGTVMLRRGKKVTIDAEKGGMVEGLRGSSLQVPKGALVTYDGKDVKGDVDVYLTPIDPSVPEELTAAPGDFRTKKGKKTQVLESFGMVDVTIEQQGEELNVKEGKVLTALIPPPANVAKPPETMPLYSFEEKSGMWVLEGEATFDPELGGYKAELPHLSAWNCDQPLEATCETGKVVDIDGKPIKGARIRGNGVDYNGQSEAVTNENGEFAVAVRVDSQIDIVAEHPKGGGQVRRVNSGSTQVDPPPELGASGCKDGGTWVIEEGKFDSGGAKLDCADAQSSLSDNECLADFGRELSKCEAKFSGECTTEVSDTGASTTYADGSKMVQSAEGTQVYDGDGKLCYETSYDTESDSPTVTYDFGEGQTYDMQVSDSDETTIVCPSGESFKLTSDQNVAIEACQPDDSGDMTDMGGSTSVGGCTIIFAGSDGTGGTPNESGSGGSNSSSGGNASGSGGSDGTYCTDDNQCADGEVCCDLGSGFLYCLNATTCDAVQAGGG